MAHLGRTLRFASTAAVVATMLTAARAELSQTSPFLPPQSQATAAPTAPPPLELRGVSTLENVTVFNIYDPTAKKNSAWLKLNEAGPGFTVRGFDPNSETVTVDYQGRTLKLVIRTPKIASSGPLPMIAPVAAPLVMQTPTAPALAPRPAVPNPAVPNPAPAGDAARMKEWTDEIQRRRDMRNQGATTPTAAPPTAASPQTALPTVGQPRPVNPPGNSQTRSGQ